MVKSCSSRVSKIITSPYTVKQPGFKALLGTNCVRYSLPSGSVPAMVYAVQNVMIQISLQNLDGLTFNLLNQSKTIFTAVALFLIMGRKQSLPQVAALLGLLGASVVLSGGGIFISTTQAVEHSDVFYLGIIPCLAASMLSGLASGLSQFTLQTGNRNSFVFTMELCVYSSLTLLVSLLFSSDGEIIAKRGFFAGWNTMVLIPVLTNGVGGIMVGLVMKYAGGVRKGFAIIIGILITGLIQRMLYETPLTNEMLLALPIVLVSTLVHIRNPYIELQKDVKKSQ